MDEITLFYTGLESQFSKIIYYTFCQLQNSSYTQTFKYMPLAQCFKMLLTMFSIRINIATGIAKKSSQKRQNIPLL